MPALQHCHYLGSWSQTWWGACVQHSAVRETFNLVLWVNIKPNKLLWSVEAAFFSITTENPPRSGFLWCVIMLMCENKHMVGSLPCIRVWEAFLYSMHHSISLQPPLSSRSHSLNAWWTLLCIMTWQSLASAAETSASLIHVLLMIYHYLIHAQVFVCPHDSNALLFI